jgi:hypothetical protein
MDWPGGIFVRSLVQIALEDRTLFLSVARVTLSDSGGTLSEQLDRSVAPVLRVPRLVPTREGRRYRETVCRIAIAQARVGVGWAPWPNPNPSTSSTGGGEPPCGWIS